VPEAVNAAQVEAEATGGALSGCSPTKAAVRSRRRVPAICTMVTTSGHDGSALAASLRRLIPTPVPHPRSIGVGVGASLILARNPMNTPSNPHQKRLIVDATEWTARLERLADMSKYSPEQPTSASPDDRPDHGASVDAGSTI
jgi:hypothetical protein